MSGAVGSREVKGGAGGWGWEVEGGKGKERGTKGKRD
jgi:hypothetical protein